jgi:hypothetical protein
VRFGGRNMVVIAHQNRPIINIMKMEMKIE